MGNLRTVITITDAKESALYFDYIIPVNKGLEMVKSYETFWRDRAQLGDTPREILRRLLDFRPFPASLISILLGDSITAAGSAALGAALEVARITLEVQKRRFALREIMAQNPVCYISEAKAKLARAS
jgi:hypothetical protein